MRSTCPDEAECVYLLRGTQLLTSLRSDNTVITAFPCHCFHKFTTASSLFPSKLTYIIIYSKRSFPFPSPRDIDIPPMRSSISPRNPIKHRPRQDKAHQPAKHITQPQALSRTVKVRFRFPVRRTKIDEQRDEERADGVEEKTDV